MIVVDRFFFGDTLAHLNGAPRLRRIKADIRTVDPSVFEGVHAVLDLAAIWNDPAGPDFTITALRQATVFGLSPRMRFDLAINGMTLGVVQNGKIPVLRDGTQWRPMVHVRDTSRAFIAVIEADPGVVNGEIFNVGSDHQNFQIQPLARRVSEAAGVPFEENWYGDPDHRSYRVSFAKIRDALGYETTFTVEDAAREIAEALESGAVEPSTRTHTLKCTRSSWPRPAGRGAARRAASVTRLYRPRRTHDLRDRGMTRLA